MQGNALVRKDNVMSKFSANACTTKNFTRQKFPTGAQTY